jgi:hypothetical protein
MILLLIVAVAAIALVVVFGLKITRTRSRQRQERLVSSRRAAAAAEAQAATRSREQRRRDWDDADDALTSVLPAIKLPWPTQLPGAASNGHPDLDGEYPGFSALTPFDAAPYRDVPPYDAGAYDSGAYDSGEPEPEHFDQIPPGAERGPFDPVVPGQRPEEYRLPRRGPGQRPAQPAPAEDFMIPYPRSDEPVPAAIPGEHGTAAERARKRANAHGSHRGGHAKRRRS